jgi:16S rRNA (adenine1518-N6/adenine1519-N6)-dimethyltransferase
MIGSDSPEKSLLAQTRDLLQRYDLRAKKRLGQHFLINSAILHNILRAAELSSSDLVLEIGPGLGVLTRELAKHAGHVIAIELDTQLSELLLQTLASSNNVSVINQDILEIEPLGLIQSEKHKFPTTLADPLKYKLVANLPYYITAPILRHFCEAELKPQVMLVMVQKEVAKNIVASPGDMSILAVSLQFYGKPRIIDYVPAGNFYPPPKVDSAILEIKMYPQSVVKVSSESEFFKIVRAGFCAARKQIGNSLVQGLDLTKAEVLSLLGKAGLDSRRRAEDLSLEDWAHLERIMHEEKRLI